MSLHPRVVFEDTHLLVISKPAGLLSQGDASGEPHLVAWAQGYVGRSYVGLVHRLDRNTSGLMVLAKRTKAADRLTRALQSGELRRSYLAWLEGRLEGPAEWRHWLLKDEARNETRVVPAKSPGSKEAALRVDPAGRALWDGHDLTLARFQLETGRSHQIRVQSAVSGHPLLGDRKYGGVLAFPRPALHSWLLEFPHPMGGGPLRFEDPLPPDMARIGPIIAP